MRYVHLMRTTLTIDDDVYFAAKAIASHQGRTIGEVVTDLVRKELDKPTFKGERREGILLAPDRPGPTITTEMVNALRDDDEF